MPTSADPVQIGVIGDSNSDEYRADDNRGGAYSAVTFSWVEILERLRDIDLGPWGTRSEPRRTGYEFNWARSGAKAADLTSQQTGLAQNVRDGRVEYVLIHIGVNDFNGNSYREIYDGTLSNTALQRKVDNILSDIRAVIQAVGNAGAKIVVTSISDQGLHPAYHAQYPDPARRQRVTNAINTINDGLKSDADDSPVLAYSDIAAFSNSLIANVDAEGNLIVGDEKINMMRRGNEPHHAQLDDGAGHPGTVLSGLMANRLFLTPLNESFGTDIPLLSDQDILCVAGINTEQNCSAEPLLAQPKPPVLTIQSL